ncbi:PDZ domain-containing protein [Rheinheimera aquimaris]|uniref:PDZ domain-containing protein n=1 Tax=Rheinheimera aquimaris TaxID=412437 RepID=A0ABN1DEW3_9GAMM|nr:PDZ domain-containing protein [Rheinheimera aquimaris]MCB5212138.1 PDZ domain-containing protein [Rheinheimera aquimaris]
MNSVRYQLDIIDIAAHLISVTLSFEPTDETHLLTLPAWIPGSYMIRDFARNIVSIEASDSSGLLNLVQQDKQSWLLGCQNKRVTVVYQLYAYDLSVRAAYIDDEVAILNPACLCLAVSGQRELTHQLQVNKPQAEAAIDWRLATGLHRSSDTEFLGFGCYTAQGYQLLIDGPLLLGRFGWRSFTIADVTHYLVVTGDNQTDLTRFAEDLQRICQQQLAVFGALPDDLSSYWFLLWVTEDGYGGLEHLNSTLLLCSRSDLPVPHLPTISESYQNLLALCSHEYFHTWWVKRLKPAAFQQYALSNEQYTRQLWLYEGFTSYFDDLALVKSGLIDDKTYVKTLEKVISRVTRNPSDNVQSLTDSSFNAWTKFYKQDENAVNAIASYYAKGALLALCLDAALRQKDSTLQHVVSGLWQRYLASGTPDNALMQLLTEFGFSDLAAICQRWLDDAAPLPLAEHLPALGLELTLRPMQHADDLGGETDNTNQLFIGALTKQQQGLLQLSHVYHNDAAHQAGLMVGDILLALDGRRITSANFTQLLQRYTSNSTVKIDFFRKDRLLQCSLTLQRSKREVAVLRISDPSLCSNWLATQP